MERTLLYYPSIVIRNDQWIRQSILYWDSIGSIVPDSAETLLHQSYDIEILQREGLFRIYRPDDYVQGNEKLVKEFEKIIENKYLLKTESLVPKIHFAKSMHEDKGWLYERKMWDGLVERLIDKSLAKRESGRLRMSSNLDFIYMSLLAKHMANDDSEAITTPCTDYPQNINLVYPGPAEVDRMSVMNLSLHNVLPVPIEDVQVADIIKFKARRKDELSSFRDVISDYQDKLKQLTEPIEIRELNARFIEKIQLEVKNLSKALQGDRIHFTLGTLKNLFAIETPLMLSAMIAGLPPQIQFPLSIAGATVAGALSLSEYFMDIRNRQLDRLNSNHYSYLYHAQQEGIVFLP